MTQSLVFNDVHQLFRHRQDEICIALAKHEPEPYVEDHWRRPGGGGGRSRSIGGAVIEKGGVNTSAVWGKISESERPLFSGLIKKVSSSFTLTASTTFAATGMSLVLHPKNPMAPTVHANYRYFEIQNETESLGWFGGGADLTPCYLFNEDVRQFHTVHQRVCEGYQVGAYKEFKKRCDSYFFIPHRGESRGVGGIFFDYLHTDLEAVRHFVSQASDVFIDAYTPILEKRSSLPYTDHHVNWQGLRRGRYAEFNLVYDRGTLFGLKTNGRVESVLMSMPPQAKWQYNAHVEPGSEEARLTAVLRSPIEWV